MRADCELLILGGGCAGLSLARELSLFKDSILKVLILESRSSYENDRTWCFWKLNQKNSIKNLYTDFKYQWEKLLVKNCNESVLFSCAERPYQMLPAEHFYKEAFHTIEKSDKIKIILNGTIEENVQKFEKYWEVKTTKGLFKGRNLIDTRPNKNLNKNDSLLWQSFYGHEIESTENIFDASCPQLMNFLPSKKDIFFIYVLPLSSKRALIEITAFGLDLLSQNDLAGGLLNAVKELTKNAPYTIVRSEYGTLPMGIRSMPKPIDSSYVRVGIMSGAARPSTGYAFQRIQLWAKLCAKSLNKFDKPIGHLPDPFITRFMDNLFLKVLRSRPKEAPYLFFSIFKYGNSQSVIRFLSGEGCLFDFCNIIFSLPTKPFLKELFQLISFKIKTFKKNFGL